MKQNEPEINFMVNRKLFHPNREIVIATKHRKEQVIAPLLVENFQFICHGSNIDTDLLGTFTGEVERTLSPLAAARKKCELAMDATGADIAVSSEGSFGSHPFIPFSRVNEELVLLYDRRNGIEILGKELTSETNFSGEYISTYHEAIGFARKAGFPRHSLILRENDSGGIIFAKGVNELSLFRNNIKELLDRHEKIWLESDMRALHNPTRMKAIKSATQNLIEKMKSTCPSCSFPGYWIYRANPGLPCSWCGAPTRSTLEHEYSCLSCKHHSTIQNPHGKTAEDPMYCDHCNP